MDAADNDPATEPPPYGQGDDKRFLTTETVSVT